MRLLRRAAKALWLVIICAISMLALALEGGRPAGAAASPAADQQDEAKHWDSVFTFIELPEVDESEEFVAYSVDRLLRERLLYPESKVLALAAGEGRNAIYMAGKGLDVTGVDISPVAIAKARKAAAEKGLELEVVVADLNDYELGQGEWDMVTNIYYNPSIRIFQRIKEAVRPGGILLVEGYGSDYKGDGPPMWTRYTPNQLLEELSGWRILEYQDGIFPCVWVGGKSIPVVRVLARKPLRPTEP